MTFLRAYKLEKLGFKREKDNERERERERERGREEVIEWDREQVNLVFLSRDPILKKPFQINTILLYLI